MMKNNMVPKVQHQGGLKDGHDSKPIRPYTNPFEFMNHMSSLKKHGLTKFEFTTSVFEEIHQKQQDE